MFDLTAVNTVTPHSHRHSTNRYSVIPTAEKLQADRRFAGRGVTIAFLDSGFYPHPDFIDRVDCFHDVSGEELFLEAAEPRSYQWHGTQTVTSCAGNGWLSDGVYQGIARAARLVLVKVSDNGRISDASIEKGLRWVIANRERFNIRVLNMSLGGDMDLGLADSCVNQLAEQLADAGVVITVAAGNSAESRSIPPANAPSVITVGGYSDENQYADDGFDLYHSSFGVTADGLVKPEIIAPAMYVAAPILPGTADYRTAEVLSRLAAAPDYLFRKLLMENWNDTGVRPDVLCLDNDTARLAIESELRGRKIVATHYQHVDGTSFAAPIAASVAAQMLEANPSLTPAAVRNLLISTATRLGGHPGIRQGFGVLNAGLAVKKALSETHSLSRTDYFPPRIEGRKIVFTYHDDTASEVSLWGSFNGWKDETARFERSGDGIWQAEIPCHPAGKYLYKFQVDGTRWTEDPSHGVKEDDGLGGFNSILNIG